MALPQFANVPGGIAVVSLKDDAKPYASYKGDRVMVIGRPGAWQAIIGIPLSTKPGTYKLRVHNGTHVAIYNFDVKDKEYQIQRITIKDKRKVNPTPLDMKRINRESKLIQHAKAVWSDDDSVRPVLEQPLKGPYSSPFGLKRLFNGQPRKPHSGLDIVANEGTPIKAAASGKVINTGEYFFNGNTVFIDHGQGMITMYCHMHNIKVKEGQEVSKGEVIGTVGRTGRVTGPHLHWSVILNKAMIDPLMFIQTAK
ncbi:MAG: peptidoglycan DD-metalloendopeptidase family protein [Gammaproteobacteria bacterium]